MNGAGRRSDVKPIRNPSLVSAALEQEDFEVFVGEEDVVATFRRDVTAKTRKGLVLSTCTLRHRNDKNAFVIQARCTHSCHAKSHLDQQTLVFRNFFYESNSTRASDMSAHASFLTKSTRWPALERREVFQERFLPTKSGESCPSVRTCAWCDVI